LTETDSYNTFFSDTQQTQNTVPSLTYP